jgi:hypothetical protein
VGELQPSATSDTSNRIRLEAFMDYDDITSRAMPSVALAMLRCSVVNRRGYSVELIAEHA